MLYPHPCRCSSPGSWCGVHLAPPSASSALVSPYPYHPAWTRTVPPDVCRDGPAHSPATDLKHFMPHRTPPLRGPHQTPPPCPPEQGGGRAYLPARGGVRSWGRRGPPRNEAIARAKGRNNLDGLEPSGHRWCTCGCTCVLCSLDSRLFRVELQLYVINIILYHLARAVGNPNGCLLAPLSAYPARVTPEGF